MLDLLLISLQTIIVNQTDPCFLNLTAGADMWDNCGFTTDWLQASLIGFEWITGGYFSMFIVGIMALMVYRHYQKVIYALFVGLMMLPLSAFLFPEQFITWAFIFGFVGIGVLIWYIFIHQTKEY